MAATAAGALAWHACGCSAVHSEPGVLKAIDRQERRVAIEVTDEETVMMLDSLD
jgi:hypothetical protein